MKAYVSCGCGRCRGVPTKIKKQHKKEAHRALRRATRKAIRKNDEDSIPASVSTGYKT